MKDLNVSYTVFCLIFYVSFFNAGKQFGNYVEAKPTTNNSVMVNEMAQSLPNMWCLSWHCSSSMYKCMTDNDCRKGLFCMQGCGVNQTCTFHCIYSYMNDYFQEFMECAVTKNKCVELKSEQPPYKCKRPVQLTGKFNLLWKSMAGMWKMKKGLNNFHDCLPTCTTVDFDISRNKVKHSFYTKTLEGYDKYITNFKEVQFKKDGSVQLTYELAGLQVSEDWFIVESNQNSYLIYYCGYLGAWEYDGSMLLLSSNATESGNLELDGKYNNLCNIEFPEDVCNTSMHYEL